MFRAMLYEPQLGGAGVGGAGRRRMYFFFAIMTAFLYVSTARPGTLSNEDFSLIVAVAVFSFLGLVDSIDRRR